MSERLEQFSKEELENLTNELQAVLAKYDAEMGVSSSINIMKRVSEEILSPLQPDGITEPGNKAEEKPDSPSEEGGKGDS